MTNTMTRMIAAVAAMGLVATPIVAQASTRASDSTTVYSVSNAGPGLGRETEGEGQVQALGFILPLLTVTVVVTSVLVATGVVGEDQSGCVSLPC